MTMHKRDSQDKNVCGSTGPFSTIYWSAVDCEQCLALRAADQVGRTSIKRSHRAEGNNFID